MRRTDPQRQVAPRAVAGPKDGGSRPKEPRRPHWRDRYGTDLLRLLLAGVLLGAAACGSTSYYDVQEDWTRDYDAYEGFEAKALVEATLKVEPFRRAYVEEYARLFELAPEQKSGLLAAELEENRHELTIVIAFYTQDPAWNDLNPARGIWEVRIENERGDIAPPISIQRLNKRNPTWKTLYPFFEVHHVLYELRFERALPDGRPFVHTGDKLELVIAGAPTRLRLRWRIP